MGRLIRRVRRGVIARYLVAILAAGIIVAPFLIAIRLAMTPQRSTLPGSLALTEPWTMANFVELFERADFTRAFVNSTMIVLPAAMIMTVVVAVAGFALSRLGVPGGRFVLLLTVVGIFTPVPAIILPLFILGIEFGYTGSRLGLVFVYAGVYSSWAAFFMYAYYERFPQVLIESARTEGAGALQLLWYVVLPLSKPGLGVVFLLCFIATWNDLLVALVMLQDASLRTVTVTIALIQSGVTIDLPLQSAALLLGGLPPLLLVGALQILFKGDLLMGGVKE